MIKRYPLVLLAYFCAFFCLSIGLYIVYDSDAASAWIKTPGKVTKIVKAKQGDKTNIKYKGSGPAMTVITQRVVYSYHVEGSAYEGLGFHHDMQNFREGMSISVLYNPDNYKQSRLESAPPWYLVVMWMVFAALFYFTGAWWMRYQRRLAG